MLKNQISFVRLTEVDPTEILHHMSDPRVTEHLPLSTFEWDMAAVEKFTAMKEDCWTRDGLGHWAILSDGRYIGWGGFQKEGNEWDFGLVLRSDAFGLGNRVSKIALDYARTDERIPFVTFLLPPSRKHLSALSRIGARQIDVIDYGGAKFLKFRLET